MLVYNELKIENLQNACIVVLKFGIVEMDTF